MIQKQPVLGHNFFVILLIYFPLYNLLVNRIASSQVVSVDSETQYVVNFLNTVETQNILLQKCCNFSEVLNKDGNCIPTPTNFQPIVPLSLETRMKRAIRNSQVDNIKNEILKPHQDGAAFKLRFSFKRPSCNKGTLHQLSYNSTADGAIQITTSLQFVTKNFLDGGRAGNESLIVNAQSYCIDYGESADKIVVEFCIPENLGKLYPAANVVDTKQHNEFIRNPTLSSSPHVLLRKCCEPFHVINMANLKCVRHDIPWQLYSTVFTEIINPLYDIDHNQSLWSLDNFTSDDAVDSSHDEMKRVPLQVSWLTGTPKCNQNNMYEVHTTTDYDRYYVNSEGVLITEQNGTVAKTPKTEFCMDAVIYNQNEHENFTTYDNINNDTNSSTFGDEKFTNLFSRQMALVCFENNINAAGFLEEKKDRKFSWRTLYAILTGISSVFLLVTCMIYTILRKELKLPGWLQFAYSFALLLTFTLLTVAQLWTQAIHDISKSLCRALGYGLHFSFLVCFFYLTSMNFEIFSSFRSITLAHGFGKSRGTRRFLEFTAFSIGFPTAITALLLAVDSCDPDGTNFLESSLCGILPTTGIGIESCVFDSRHKVAQLQYFYGFVGILLMINLVIFVCTLVSLRNRERETRMAKRQSTSKCDYDRLQLFTRLFLIMGILWTFEVISWLFQYFDVDDSVQDIFIITDCLNASQGIAVFLMFVWKRQTWKQLKKKFKTSFGIHRSRPLCRPNYSGTISSSNNTNGTSVKSSHLSSTKSRDSMPLTSTSQSTVTAVGTADNSDPLIPET